MAAVLEWLPAYPFLKDIIDENIELVQGGLANLLHHVEVVKKSGIKPVVCLNSFYTDTPAEIDVVRQAVLAAGARFAVSEHWLKGGDGAIELAEQVMEACEEK